MEKIGALDGDNSEKMITVALSVTQQALTYVNPTFGAVRSLMGLTAHSPLERTSNAPPSPDENKRKENNNIYPVSFRRR